MKTKLVPDQIALEDLYLDPNNPRFVESLRLEAEVSDELVPGSQEELLKRFPVKTDDAQAEGDDDSFFGIQDLVDSMRQIGFVPIDRVVVRSLASKKSGAPTKYLVIEGNRRVSAAKKLRQLDKDETSPGKKLRKDIADSLKTLDVLVLNTDGLTPAEVHDRVGVILGLRHYGSVLPWDAMARAKNIYGEYMQGSPALQTFVFNSKRASDVARRLSVPRNDVKKALRTYVAYEQLRSAFQPGPRPDHYSLLQGLVTSGRLFSSGYLTQDEGTYQMPSESLETINQICQFEKRHLLKAEEKILPDPKSVAPFTALVADALSSSEPAVQAFAHCLLDEVERGERPVEDAKDNLTTFKLKRQWTESLGKMLERQREGLLPSDFHPVGNSLMNLSEANKAFRLIRKVLDL